MTWKNLALTCLLYISTLQFQLTSLSSLPKADEFSKLCQPASTQQGDDSEERNIVLNIYLTDSTGISLPLELVSSASGEFSISVDCKMSLDLKTVGKYNVKIENIHRSIRRQRNATKNGRTCNKALKIAFTQGLQEFNHLNVSYSETKMHPVKQFPGIARIKLPQPEIKEKEKFSQKNVFLYFSYMLTSDEECTLQFQEFQFAMKMNKNETFLHSLLKSSFCRSTKCNENPENSKPIASSKVVISCITIFFAIMFTACFVIICTCNKGCMKLNM